MPQRLNKGRCSLMQHDTAPKPETPAKPFSKPVPAPGFGPRVSGSGFHPRQALFVAQDPDLPSATSSGDLPSLALGLGLGGFARHLQLHKALQGLMGPHASYGLAGLHSASQVLRLRIWGTERRLGSGFALQAPGFRGQGAQLSAHKARTRAVKSVKVLILLGRNSPNSKPPATPSAPNPKASTKP